MRRSKPRHVEPGNVTVLLFWLACLGCWWMLPRPLWLRTDREACSHDLGSDQARARLHDLVRRLPGPPRTDPIASRDPDRRHWGVMHGLDRLSWGLALARRAGTRQQQHTHRGYTSSDPDPTDPPQLIYSDTPHPTELGQLTIIQPPTFIHSHHRLQIIDQRKRMLRSLVLASAALCATTTSAFILPAGPSVAQQASAASLVAAPAAFARVPL